MSTLVPPGAPAGDPADRDRWFEATGFDEDDAPRLVIVASPWCQREQQANAVPGLTEVQETALPGMYAALAGELPVLFASVYGDARAVEPVQVAGELGCRRAVLIGSCAALQPGIRTGDIVLAQSATIGEGASQYYGGHGTAAADTAFTDQVENALWRASRTSHRGRVMTASALLPHPRRLVQSWAGAGHLALDLETSAFLTAAAAYGMTATVLLAVRLEPLAGQDWIDAIRPGDDDLLDEVTGVMYQVALEIAQHAES